ncbi:MAG: COG1361 S-layer family protein [Wujia sp.]
MQYKKSKIAIGMVMVLFVCLFTYVSGIKTEAAEPKVLVTAYSVTPETVVSGEEFSLSVTVMNTSKNKVRNMKVSVLSETGELYAVGNTGSTYVAELAGNSEQELTFAMCAASGLAEKSYKLTVKMEYEDGNGTPYTMEDVLYLPVVLKQRLSVTDILSDTVKVGDDVELSAKVNNLGEGSLYNVSAAIEGEHVQKQTTYIGTIESGKSGTIDLITKATHITDETEVLARDVLTITYEDKDGNVYTEKTDVWFSIDTVTYEDLETLKEAPEKSGISMQTWIVIGIFLLFAVLLVIQIGKWRKKKKRLEEI